MQLGIWIDKFLEYGGVITLCKPKIFKPRKVRHKKYLLPNCEPKKFKKVCILKKRRGLICKTVVRDLNKRKDGAK